MGDMLSAGGRVGGASRYLLHGIKLLTRYCEMITIAKVFHEIDSRKAAVTNVRENIPLPALACVIEVKVLLSQENLLLYVKRFER